MSLIPSESYSFPDHFTTTVTPSRKPKEQKIDAARVEKPRPKPRIVALPDPPPPMAIEPETIFEEPPVEEALPEIEPPAPEMPVLDKPAPPNPALRRASAPPPKIPPAAPRKMAMPVLKPKVRWNNRATPTEPAPAQDNGSGPHDAVVEQAPAQNVIPIHPAKVPARPSAPPPAALRPMPVAPPPGAARPMPAPQPIQTPVPKPAPVAKMRPAQQPASSPKPRPAPVSSGQSDFFEMFAEDNQGGAAMKRRRQMKFRRFVAYEGAALAVLLPLVILGLTLDVNAPALRWIMNIFTIVAAVAAAIIPIVFYAFTPTLPELER
jgi:hypothetical protein